MKNLNEGIWAYDMMYDEPETCAEGFACQFDEDGVCDWCGDEEDE